MTRSALWLGLSLIVGCAEEASDSSATATATSAAYLAVEARAASSTAPARFGFGRSPSPEEIGRLDIDIRPDGAGLPEGSGTVEQGRELYDQRCIACHGADGTGGPNDQLVGTEAPGPDGRPRTIGNYWPYATTLFDYIRRAMPFDAPGTLTDDQVYASVAHLLYLNGIIPEDHVMDATTLPLVEMPARGHFVRDDRLEFNVVR